MSSYKFVSFYFISLFFFVSFRSFLEAQSDVDWQVFDLNNEEGNLEKHEEFSSPFHRKLKRNLKKIKRKLPRFFKKSRDHNISVSYDDIESFIKVSKVLLHSLKHDTVKENSPKEGCDDSKTNIRYTEDSSEVVEVSKYSEAQEISLKSLMYKEPSEWSPCTRSCKTKRTRECRLPGLCSEDVRIEEAFCFFPGSICELIINEMLHSQEHNTDYTDEENQYGSTDYDDYVFHIHEDYNEWDDPAEANFDEGNYDTPEPDAEVFQSPPTPIEDEIGVDEPFSSAGGECGRAFVSVPSKMFRIIGGKEASKGSWPWQVAILDSFKYVYCGGTIIGSRWILTAAHCVQRKISVRVLEHDTSLKDGEREIKVQKSYINPGYDVETYDSDIALLKLKSDVTEVTSKPVRRACIPGITEGLPRGKTCIVLGWGKEKENHRYGSDVLRYAKVPIVGNKACQRAYEHHNLTKNMFCAGYLSGGIDTCEGDSGGPLLCQDYLGRWVVYGITSFGEGCGRKGRLGVYVKVSNYWAWINDTMSIN